MPEEQYLEAKLEGKTLLLVDGSSYLYRAYHALPDLRGPDGEPTGALYGIINMLRRMRKEVTAEYSACVFDAKGKTFRDDWYPDYKANRASMPEDLVRQILVPGRHDDFHAALFGGNRKRANDVVGLHALDHYERPAERPHGLVDGFDLFREVIGHGRPVCLVIRIPVVTKCLAFGIKYARAILCIDVFSQPPQHVDHSVQRAGWTAVRAA